MKDMLGNDIKVGTRVQVTLATPSIVAEVLEVNEPRILRTLQQGREIVQGGSIKLRLEPIINVEPGQPAQVFTVKEPKSAQA